MLLTFLSFLMGQQQVPPSRFHACGHARSTEAQVVKTEKEYQDGVNLPSWSKVELVISDKDNVDKDAVIGVRDYQGYVENRKLLFSIFPQLDTEVLEAEARKLTLEGKSNLVDVMDRLSTMADKLEAEASTRATSCCSPKCRYAQVQVVHDCIPDSESSKPGWKLAKDMLADYDKAKGHRHAKMMLKTLRSITCLHNPVLEAKFKQRKNQLEKRGIMQREYILYHGTNVHNAIAISKNGFDKNRIKSKPMGFFLATWPGVSLKYGGLTETVVLACKVLLGNVRFEKEATVFDPRQGLKYFVGYNSMVRECTKDALHEGPYEPVTRRIFILSEADQILPVGMFNYTGSLTDSLKEEEVITPDATFKWESQNIHLTRVISPLRLDMTKVWGVINQLKRKTVWPGGPDDAIRKIKYFEDIVKDYDEQDLCVKYGFASSRMTSVALVEFLDWADSVLETESISSPRSRWSKQLQEDTYFMDSEEFNDEDTEDMLYESEDEDPKYFEVDETT